MITPEVSSTAGEHAVNAAAASSPTKRPRLYYIDKLRVFLTFLVLIHHCFWVVLAGWIPFARPWPIDKATDIISSMVLSGNQAYFMGLFFFLSGLVAVPSLKRKGAMVFIKDRFIRLMIPAIVYDLLLFPLIFCFTEAAWYGPQRGFTYGAGDVLKYYYENLGKYIFHNNHMWFTVTLFMVSTSTVILVKLFKSVEKFLYAKHSMQGSLKNMMTLLTVFAAILVICNYPLRAPFIPKDIYPWVPVVANVGFISQYTLAFWAGMLANSFQFLDHLGKRHLPITVGCSLVFYVVYMIFQVYLSDFFRDAMTIQGQYFIITLFEQFFGVFWAYSLLVVFKEYQNEKPSQFLQLLIGAAYATYIIHQWIILPLAVGFAYTSIHPLGVIALLIVLNPVFSWGAGILLKAIPGSDIIL